MKSIKLLWLGTAALAVACSGEKKPDAENEKETDKVMEGAVVDNYFGTDVSDPYRWLEDDNSEETAEWVKGQNDKTFGHLDQIPFRSAIKERLTEIWDYPKISAPGKHGERYFYFKNNGLQAQSVMYVSESIEDEGEVFLDPNGFSEDGTVSLAGLSFSDDDKYLAYSISSSGSDWNEWFVMDANTGELLEDHIEWTKFGGASWYKDGFFYTRYPEPKEGDEFSAQNSNSQICYHRLGASQSEDVVIWEDPENPTHYNFGGTTEDDQYYVLVQSPGTHGQNLKLLKLTEEITPSPEFTNIIDDFNNDHNVVTTKGEKLVVYTNYNAPNYRVVVIDPSNPAPENWVELIPETDNVLQGASTGGGKLFLTYLKDASSRVYVHNLEGERLHEVELPTLGTAGGFGTKADRTELFYSFTSYTYPSTIYHYDIETNTSKVFRTSQVKFSPEEYETKEVFYNSTDGEQVHMFVTHKKGLELNGDNPTLLYGYGGFNISLTPSFNPANIVWLENNGVLAVANLRGGGEYGEEWHKAGMLENKQNVFNDFITAAEKLIADGYTSSEKLAIKGGSNGGLLVGACMTQRPELFKVALPAVGVLDMLRFHKFTVGKGWVVEYGSSDNEEQFKTLLAYSPLHNLKKGTSYPATMVMTADHDDRVVPAHSFKFAATLQDCHEGDNPVLIRVETKAGHGAGKSTQQTIDENTDQWAFIFYNMGIEPKL